jgi:transaldolase
VANQTLAELTDLGVSVWLDDLDRSRLEGGGLAGLIHNRSVRGVTTNPTIFQKAIATGPWYESDITALRAAGSSAEEVVWDLMIRDVQAACDVFRPVWESTEGLDGRVSLEVDPRLAHDTQATATQAAELWARLDRPNAFIKIPATQEGLPAITAAIAAGISVNVTLIFSLERYRAVIAAYLDGLELALSAGRDIGAIASVASFFVSRVDTEVDARLESMANPAAQDFLGSAAIANARLAWGEHQATLQGDRWRRIAEAGAQQQRPLWASTGVKNPAYDDTRYVIDLAVPGTVNTMPEATLEAVAQHGTFRGDQVTPYLDAARTTLSGLAELGIDMAAVCAELEIDGVRKFQNSWQDLLAEIPD